MKKIATVILLLFAQAFAQIDSSDYDCDTFDLELQWDTVSCFDDFAVDDWELYEDEPDTDQEDLPTWGDSYSPFIAAKDLELIDEDLEKDE